MRLNKNQEKAVTIALAAITTLKQAGLTDEDMDFAAKELIDMKDKSRTTKGKERGARV